MRALSTRVPSGLAAALAMAGLTGFALPGGIGRAAPQFEVPPSPCGTIFRIQVGTATGFTLRAADEVPDARVALAAVVPPGLPRGAALEQPSPANPVEASFSWTPAEDQVGDHRVLFGASSRRNAELLGVDLCRVFFKVSAGEPPVGNGTLREKAVVELTVEVRQPGQVVVVEARTGRGRAYPAVGAVGSGTGRFLVGPLDLALPDGTIRIASVEKRITVTNLEAVNGGVVFNATLEKTVEVEVDSAFQTLTRVLEFAGLIPVPGASPGAAVEIVDGPRVVGETEEVIDP